MPDLREDITTPELASSRAEEVLRIVRSTGMIRARDLAAKGISPTHLQRLYEQGVLERSGRGVYFAPTNEGDDYGRDFDENLSLAEVCLRVPRGVVCLLSALRFHNLTTQLPRTVWLAIPTRAHVPAIDYPPVRVIRMGGESFTTEIQEVSAGSSVPIHVYSPAKTVADCFKYRSHIGDDVAIVALKDCLRKRMASVDDLWRCARICRVANIMRPYLESLMAE